MGTSAPVMRPLGKYMALRYVRSSPSGKTYVFLFGVSPSESLAAPELCTGDGK